MATVDASLTRVLTLRMRLGLLDPRDDQPYAQIPASDFGSEAHSAVNTDTGSQGLVLLKNEGGVLPFARGLRVAVVGPHSVSQTGLLEGRYPCTRTAHALHVHHTTHS